MNKKVVFLLGAGHCGSTLLDLILGSHSRAFSLGEFNRIQDLIGSPDEAQPKICGVCPGQCEFWNKRASLSTLKLFYANKKMVGNVVGKIARYICNPYKSIFTWSGKDILVDSSKRIGWFHRQMVPAYVWHDVTPFLIYLCRDGRAVVNSYNRKYPDRGIVDITKHWKSQVVKMNDYYNRFPIDHKIRVHYEELASNPENTLRSICNILNLEFEKDMLRYWMYDHHHINGNAGTRSLIFKYREQFGFQLSDERKDLESEEKYYGDLYYNELELAIKLDQRWMKELTEEQLDIFDSIAGDENKPFICNIK